MTYVLSVDVLKIFELKNLINSSNKSLHNMDHFASPGAIRTVLFLSFRGKEKHKTCPVDFLMQKVYDKQQKADWKGK